MIHPHRVVDQGRVILFEGGPLSMRDLYETIRHVQWAHTQRPTDAYLNADQMTGLAADPQFAEAMRFEPQTEAGIRRVMGVRLHLHYPQNITYTTTTNNTWQAANATFLRAHEMMGVRITSAFIDELKPARQVATTHEEW